MAAGASNLRKFFLLLWKNFLLQKRKILVTVFEILLPTIFSLILIWIRQKVDATPVHNATTWHSFKVDTLPQKLCPDVKQQCFLNVPWKLYYTPENAVVDEVMHYVQSQLGHDRLGEVRSFETEHEMVTKIMADMESQKTGMHFHDILGGIVFYNWDASGKIPANLTYKIRLSASPKNAGSSPSQRFNPFGQDTRWMTTFQFPLFQRVGPRARNSTAGGLPGYKREGFLALQHAINQGVMSIISGNSTMPTPVVLRRMPYPPYNDDPFVIVVQNQLPLLLMLSFVFIALNIVKDVVHEKEKRIKETLKLMGLPNWMHWLAWFTKHIIFLAITVGIITGLFVIQTGKNGAIIGYSSPTVLLVFLLVYSMATISFCFAVSVFFNKANTAAAAGGVLFFLTYVPYFFLQPRYDKLSWEGKISSCLISNVALAYGGQIFGMFEGTGAGVQWNTIHQSVSVDDDFTLLHVILMLLLDTFLYGLLTWYVEAVRPGEFGIPQPWYFPVLKSYWCNAVPKGDDDEDLAGPSSQNSEFFEKDPIGLRAGISIQGLRKVFGKGDQQNVAVADTTLNMYEGQITALLGHNGAGKTTTMNMLTGFLPPTSGTAIVNGFNIRREISSVRNSLGLCPQHDVLFDTLTVEEHLIFFALIKGYSSSQLKHEIRKMLRSVGLYSKRSVQTKTLSGGQKRKLSVAIALIGGSKVVILDEPTSGMDPNARRHLWDVLQRHRAGRTMLLTTHFMDEADLLGDRIAIMADGVIQCCGSSLFLKNEYGAGYHMIIVKLLGCDVTVISNLVKSYVPAARLESNISAELSYILPTENSDKFELLFSELEERSEELKIASFGASVTTMEEVFLRVGESMDDTLKEKLQHPESMTSGPPAEPLFNVNIELNDGWRLTLQQFQAMLVKRILHTRRNLLVTLTQLFIPTFFTIIGLVILKTHPAPGDSPALTLSLSAFGDNVLGLSSGENPNNLSLKLADSYASIFRSDPQTRVAYLNNMTEYVKDPSLMDYFIHEGGQSLGTYVNRYIVGAEFLSPDEEANETMAGVGFFNDQAYHTPALSLSVIQTSIMRFLNGGANKTFTTINHPLPRTLKDKLNDELSLDFTGFVVSFHAMFGMAFLASSFVLFLIKERASKAKHCQFVSGVDSVIFWCSTFAWDFINYMLPVVLLLVAFYGFNVVAYIEGIHLVHILLLFVVYGWACLPFMYVLSFLFSIPSTGFVWLTMLNVISGVGTVIAVRILQLPQLDTKAVGDALKWIFLAFLPNFSLGQALQDYYQNHQYLNICTSAEVEFLCKIVHMETPCCKGHCGDNCLDYTTDYLSWSEGGIGRMLVFLSVQGVFFFSIIFMMESGLIRRVIYWIKLHRSRPMRSRSNSIHSQVQEDEDVVAERERISSMAPDDLVFGHTLVLSELTKYYGNLLAVDRLSFGIRRSQCFGLLGNNGAGKTTTFKMLTGDLAMSSGNAFLQGYDIRNNIKQVQQRLGYCPQFDALIDQLTGRETLTMYCRLRGVSSRQIPGMVEQVIRTLLLSEHADKLVMNYSGGNKRKLSAAIALVGDPPVIFLDEPTTGMDPVARRLLWDTLSRMRDSGSTLVLTSHSMEECEALCTQIAIMVNGQTKCFGSTQHLKTKFGHGYTLLARIGVPRMPVSPDDSMDIPEPDVQPFMEYIESSFPGSALKDIHQGMVHYHIPDSKVSWSKLFGTMEKCKGHFNIEDYSVSQTTLEQVFINFARSQVEPQEAKASRCQRCRQGAPWCFSSCCCLCPGRCNNGDDEDDEDLLNIVDHEIA